MHRFQHIFDFVKVPIFAEILNSPGDAKNEHISNLTKKGPRRVTRYLKSKFDKKFQVSQIVKRNCRYLWYKVV